jgi:hypothetical protein
MTTGDAAIAAGVTILIVLGGYWLLSNWTKAAGSK